MNKLIQNRHEICWYIIDYYLDAILNLTVVDKDIKFGKLFNEMRNYVNGKITLENGGDVVDSFVVVLQKSEN